MRLGIAVPDRHVTKPVLDAALEATTRLDEDMISKGAPTFDQAGHKVQWRPEPPNQEHFDHLGKILPRGWGDCDDLAPWHAASLRHTGEDPDARAVVYKSGPTRWHAVVERGDGSIDDPSAWRGMHEYQRKHGVAGVSGSSVYNPLVSSSVGSVGAFSINPLLALRPLSDGKWEARADLPWNLNFIPWNRPEPGLTDLDVAMAALHRAPVASQAIAGAVCGAAKLVDKLDCQDPEWCGDFLEAVEIAHQGADWDDIADIYGEDIADAVEGAVGALWGNVVVGAFRPFRGISRGAKKLFSSKGGKFALKAIPGLNTYMMARGAKGAIDAGKKDKSFGSLAKGFTTEALRGGVEHAEANPFMKRAAAMMGMEKALAEAKKQATKAADALDAPAATKEEKASSFERGIAALKEAPAIATPQVAKKLIKSGVFKPGRVKAVRSPGGGIREVIIRA